MQFGFKPDLRHETEICMLSGFTVILYGQHMSQPTILH